MSLPGHDPRLNASGSPASRRTGWRKTCSLTSATCRRGHVLGSLYVVDTSFLPRIGAVNPALTAMANPVRVGDHLMQRRDARQPESEAAHVA